MKHVIEVDHLVKRYKKAGANAVDDISFSVEEGEFFALLGPNGAGKTTTIQILISLLSKTTGTVTIAGYDIDKEPAQVRRSIGVIFQQPSLDLNLTAEENIRFHAILYGLYPYRPLFSMMPQIYKNKVQELAKILGVEKDLFKPIKTLSGGMKRKLEIVRSLLHSPKVLFLDEPTSGLDPLSRRNLWQYLTKVRKTQHTTIFLTTHYLEEAEEADRVCIINNGKIVSFGTPEKIKNELIEEFVLLDAKDRKKLVGEIKKLKYKYEEDEYIKVYIEKHTAQDIIKSIQTPLSRLDVHAPTLEEAYLEIVEPPQKKDL